MGWINISSSHYDSSCGDEGGGYEATDMLDANGEWTHVVNENHWLILDLGSSKDIKKMRFRGQGTAAPDDMDIYISDNKADWGTAVATAVDPNSYGSAYTDVDVTDKTGRYVKFDIISTEHGSNYLGWGDTTNKMIDIWEGEIPDRWTTYINLSNINHTTDSASYNPTDGSLGITPFDKSKYTNIIAAYFEATGYYTNAGTPDGPEGVYVQLYDRTNSTQIALVNCNGTAGTVSRSADISGNLPATAAEFDIRVKKGNADSGTMTGARLIIVQEAQASGDGNKTRIYIPLGGSAKCNSTSYSKLGSFVGSYVEKHYYWDEDKFATIDAVYYGATLKATSGYTAYAQLDTTSGDSSVTSLSETSTNPTWNISSEISGSISDNTTYTTWIKSSASRQWAYIYNAILIVDLTSVTKYETTQQINAYGLTTTSSGWTEDKKYQVQFDSGNDWFKGTTVSTTYHTVIRHTGDLNMQSSIYDDGTRDSDADLLTTETTFTLYTSGNLTITDGSKISQGYNLGESGDLKSGQVGEGRLLRTVTDINALPEGINFQINIGDEWKDVDSIKINIGDTWKDVAGAKLNIGDTWKDIF
ncbi:MAG: discoidin domain-containing protein [Candidatus Heimdallarchaeaceae archaeon]